MFERIELPKSQFYKKNIDKNIILMDISRKKKF